MSASASQPRRRRGDADAVTVAHLDDAIDLALDPIRRDMHDLRAAIAAAIDRLDRRPVRRFARWFVTEAHSAYRTGTAAGVGACVAVLVAHLT